MQTPAFCVFVARYFLHASPVRNSTSPLFLSTLPFFFLARERNTPARAARSKNTVAPEYETRSNQWQGPGARHLARPTKYNNIARVHAHTYVYTYKHYVQRARTDKPLLDNLVDSRVRSPQRRFGSQFFLKLVWCSKSYQLFNFNDKLLEMCAIFLDLFLISLKLFLLFF